MSAEQEGPASPEAAPGTGDPSVYDGRADEHARALAEAQEHAWNGGARPGDPRAAAAGAQHAPHARYAAC